MNQNVNKICSRILQMNQNMDILQVLLKVSSWQKLSFLLLLLFS